MDNQQIQTKKNKTNELKECLTLATVINIAVHAQLWQTDYMPHSKVYIVTCHIIDTAIL